MKKYLIIHGHFYQPPRESPWTGLIEKQDSAAPYHDWNERINKECYAANTSSRVLDSTGRVKKIVNNYTSISHNFGPTLLDWIERNSSDIYQRIIAADSLSMKKNNGHGNAIAQVYNHIILPLANREDKITQIEWGKENFYAHYGRDPEGMWLAETAIDQETIDLLIDAKMKFVILSPWQAEAIEVERDKWIELDNNPAPCDRAFILPGVNGKIAVFFYHPSLASDISFGHLCQDADRFHQVLKDTAAKIEGELLNIATDGEIYGHHEPFADMCLAALIEKIKHDDDFQLTNYANYLELNPPTTRARLRPGEEGKGSSWSCSHGVSRWYKDCGCNTGGFESWNQQWRGPLRAAFDALSEKINQIYKKELAEISDIDPYEVRNRYGKVLSERLSFVDFSNTILKKPGKKESSKLFRLLEGQKYSLFSYTSCGWFFSEISGIEPVQNLRYALRSATHYQTFCDTDLFEPLLFHLKKAQSNIPGKGTGADIFHTIISENRHKKEAAAGFLLAYFSDIDFRNWGFYSFAGISGSKKKGEIQGSVMVEDKGLLSVKIFDYKAHFNKNQLSPEISIRGNNEWNTVKLIDLPFPLRKKIIAKTEEEAEQFNLRLFKKKQKQENAILSRFHKLNVPVPQPIEKSIALSYHYKIITLLKEIKKTESIRTIETLSNFLSPIQEGNIPLFKDEIEETFKKTSYKMIFRFILSPSALSTKAIQLFLRAGYKIGIIPYRARSQTMLFDFLSATAHSGLNEERGKEFQRGILIGELMNLDIEDFKED